MPQAQAQPETADKSASDVADRRGENLVTLHSSRGVSVGEQARKGCRTYQITLHPEDESRPDEMFARLHHIVKELDATIVTQQVFGACDLAEEGLSALERKCGEVTWPVSWLEGLTGSPARLTGIQVYAVADCVPKPLFLNGRPVGAEFEDDVARYCLLWDFRPADLSASRKEQAREVFEAIPEFLASVGMTLRDVVRTWLFIDRILDWYDDFNVVRNRFFEGHDVFEALVPASTGVGAANPAGAALSAGVLGVAPKGNSVRRFAVPSPLQCSALDYRSAFSRAVEVDGAGLRSLYISGTASIEPGGKTAYAGDVDKQIALTMRVVGEILRSRSMGWEDVSRGIAYFRNSDDLPRLERFLSGRNIDRLPLTVAHCDICRDDLLFEIEVDAVATRPSMQA